jgi:uncharacterized protein YcnI
MDPRARHWRILAVVAAVGGVLLAASPAWAHVDIDPSSEPRASAVVFGFRTPNEEQSASSVRLDVQFPTDHPFLNVLVEDKPGWTFTTQTGPLPKPVTTDDGTFTTAVTEVTWMATGGGTPPGAFDRFNVLATTPSSGSKVTFKAIQTYSNGDVVRWIELPVKGAPKPEHPAPTLTLTKAPPSGG